MANNTSNKKRNNLFKIFRRKRKQRDASPYRDPQAGLKTPDRDNKIPNEIDFNSESPKSMVSLLSLKSALEVAAEKTSSVLQYRPSIRLTNLLPSLSVSETHSVEKSLIGGYSDRGTPTSRQPSSKKILFPKLLDDVVFPRKSSFLTRTKFFRKIVEEKFRSIDSDGSGSIDRDELYVGVLMVHLELAKYVGASACQPATRQYVNALFDSLDINANGSLDIYEFSEIMVILCSQITIRVMLQWSMTLIFMPLIAHYLVFFSVKFFNIAGAMYPSFIIKYEQWKIELFEIGPRLLALFNLENIASYIYNFFPDNIMIMTSILTIMFVPWFIDTSDQLFLSIGRGVRSNTDSCFR